MALVENRFVCDLSKPVQAQALKGNVFSLDNLGSRLSVLIYDNGQPATISGSVTANCILPDGSTVNVNGGLTTENGGSKAYVDIPQSCLLIPGILKIAIKCTSSSVITTLAAIVANVYMTKTDNVITPSQQIITDWNAEISAAIATQNAAIANQDTKINDLKSAINNKIDEISEPTKNLFDIQLLEPLSPNYTTIRKTADSIHIAVSGMAQTGVGWSPVAMVSGKKYVLSADITVVSGRCDLCLQISSDGTTWVGSYVLFKAETTGHYSIGFTCPSSTYYRFGILDTVSGVTSFEFTVSNLMLEEGTSETSYVSFLTAVDTKVRADLLTEISNVENEIIGNNEEIQKIRKADSKNLANIWELEPLLPKYTSITKEPNSIRIITDEMQSTGVGYLNLDVAGRDVLTVSADCSISSGIAKLVMQGTNDTSSWSSTSIIDFDFVNGYNKFTFVVPTGYSYYRCLILTTNGTYSSADVTISNLQIEKGYFDTNYVNYYSAEDSVARESDLQDVALGEKNARLGVLTTSVRSIIADNSSEASDTSRSSVKKVAVYSKKEIRQGKTIPDLRKIVALNHDDILPSDYLSTRKIYNKYHFNGNYNFILKPFTSNRQIKEFCENIRQIVKDGNSLGLHAIGQESAWIVNGLMDIRPDGSSTFGPTPSQVKTSVRTESGKQYNVFGFDLAAVPNSAGFISPYNDYASIPIGSLTDSQIYDMLTGYCIFSDKTAYTGLDLDGVSRTWNIRKWIEHWHNRLVGDIGYSSDSSDISTHFESDYDIPSGASIGDYYPDATHMLNGKMVFFDDTTNPNYSNAEYQKVGRFKSGIYKGCASTCNGEITDRLIQTAKAFLQHYTGFGNLSYHNRHGARWIGCAWYDDRYIPYANEGKTILFGLYTKVYNSRRKQFLSAFDHLKIEGIRITGHTNFAMAPGMNRPLFEGQVGLFFGQDGIRSPFFNSADYYNGDINYLAAIDTVNPYGWGNISRQKFMQYYGNVANWIKYTYEHADENIGSEQSPMYVMNHVKRFIDAVRSCEGTGKIPFFSYDTVVDDASCLIAFEMICQYCYDHNITIVTPEEARLIATNNKREYLRNYIPNPQFNQGLIDYFGGSSTEIDAYIPDGWAKYEGNVDAECSVSEENGKRILTVQVETAGTSGNIATRIYGLDSGTYRLSFGGYRQSTEQSGTVRVYLKKNKDFILRWYGSGSTANFNPVESIPLLTSDSDYSCEITIPDPVKKPLSNDVDNQISFGYEENVCCVVIELFTKEKIVIHDLKLEKV